MGFPMDRYARQLVLAQIGPHGQARLHQSSVLVVGAGALGSRQAELLARAGVGRLRIADRDFVQLDNLPRQALFDEEDARLGRPKAEAARRRLAQINREVAVEPMVIEVTARNIESLLTGVEVVLDGTDNPETRYLVNDACCKLGIPWIYGGVLGTRGVVLPVRPGVGPCLRCVFPDPPAPGTLATCDRVGVLNTAPALVATLQATAALRWLLGAACERSELVAIDLWEGSFRTVPVDRSPDCPCCVGRRFDFLEPGT